MSAKRADPMQATRERTAAHVARISESIGAEMGRKLRGEVTMLLALADRMAERSELEMRVWRARYSRVSKVNAHGPAQRARAKMIIARRISIVEVVEKDGRMRRAMVDLLRDVADDIDREWDW